MALVPTEAPTTTAAVGALPSGDDSGGGSLGWLWALAAVAAIGLAAWFVAWYQGSRQAAVAGALAGGAAAAPAVRLPWRQRFRALFAGGGHRVRGPSLWQRIQMSSLGGWFATRSQRRVGRSGWMSRIRAGALTGRWRRSEASMSLRARREAREVQRRIRERRPDG